MSGMTAKELEGVNALGTMTKYPTEYDPSVLEKFVNPNVGSHDLVCLDCFEFGSLCPKTHQPDLGIIHISYIPDQYLVESKSLKLFLFSFRNHGAFHEKCVDMITQDLVDLLNPFYIETCGDFHSRGGISIIPFSAYARDGYEEFKKQRQLAVMQAMLNHHPNRI